MSQKHIFIGLGGAGINTVAQIKNKIYQKISDSKRFEKMNEKYRFLFVDTDSRDVENYNKKYYDIFENGTVPFINPQTDLISLSQANPQAIYKEALLDPEPMINHRILEACSPELAAKIPDQPLKFGAGAFRMKSRIAFARSMSEFQQKLQAHIEELNNVKNSGGEENTISYWVVCSTNGGTGSGIVNDVLYYTNMQHRRSIGDGDPHLVLVMYMPKYYIDKNSTEEKYSTNAFSVFSEISAVKSMSMDERRNKVFHRLALTKDYNLIDESNRYDPFYYLIPVDCQTDNGTNIGSAMYSNAAEMLYYIHDGEGGTALNSDVDNYMHDLYNERPEGFLVPMGYIALRKPEEEFRQYMAARIEKDILKHGLLNETRIPTIDEAKARKFYDEIFAFDTDEVFKGFEAKRFEAVNKLDPEQYSDEVKLPDELTTSTPNECANIFETEIKKGGFEDKLKAVKLRMRGRLWEEVENHVKEYGFTYTLKLFDELEKYAKSHLDSLIKSWDTEYKEKVDQAELQTQYEDAKEYSIGEKFNKESQRAEIRAFCESLETLANGYIDKLLWNYKISILEDFYNLDGRGEIEKLRSLLEKLCNEVKSMSKEADDKYNRLARIFNDKALDVTSVYLPEIKSICNGDGWIKDNCFSKWYNSLVDYDSGEADGNDNLPRRNGDHSLESVMAKIYEPSGAFAKDIISNKYVVNKDTIRFFANEDLPDSREAATRIEAFVTYARKYFEKMIEEDTGKISEEWHKRGISQFFADLPNNDKDRIRRSLSPCLFFNYKSNKIAVDYREFLIFVTSDEELAKQMLGYQDGNPMHKFVKSNEMNAAFVIRAKYGLSFSDYRLYDNLKDLYEKAAFREKFHFHRYFAEFGASILPEDLPYEIAPAHRVFAKMLLLNEYKEELEPFFYEPDYESKKADFAKSVLILGEKDNAYQGMFQIAKMKAISEKDGKLCMVVDDSNAKMYSVFEGNNFIESFADYERNFIHYSINQTYKKYIAYLYKQRIMVENHEQVGEKIIGDLFESKRRNLLEKLDKMIVASRTEKEKSIYRILLKVVDEEIRNVRDLI